MKLLLSVVISLLFAAAVHAQEGIISQPSQHDVDATADRLEAALEEQGMRLFARIDHSANAAMAGKALRPTTLVIFGNPTVGTSLMQCSQSIGIELPQKMLIWQAEDGVVYVGYNDPAVIASRHSANGCSDLIGKLSNALDGFARAAATG